MLPQHYRLQSSQPLELNEEEQQRKVTDLTPYTELSFKQRIVRGLNCCVFILKGLGYTPPPYLDHTYGEEFIEVLGVNGTISAKLIEPCHVCNIESIAVVVNDTVKCLSTRQFLSQYIDSPWVIYFLKPIKDGHPLALPVVESPTVEKDVVRGFFFCLNSLGFKFTGQRALPNTRIQLQNLRLKLTGDAQVVDYISSHLLPESVPG